MASRGSYKSKKSAQMKTEGKDNTKKSPPQESSLPIDLSIATGSIRGTSPPRNYVNTPFHHILPGPDLSSQAQGLTLPNTTNMMQPPATSIIWQSPEVAMGGPVVTPAPTRPRLPRIIRPPKSRRNLAARITPPTSPVTNAGNAMPPTVGCKAAETIPKKKAKRKSPPLPSAKLSGVTIQSISPSQSVGNKPPSKMQADTGNREASNKLDGMQSHRGTGTKPKKKAAEPVRSGPSTSSHCFDEELTEQEAMMFEPENIQIFLNRMKEKAKLIYPRPSEKHGNFGQKAEATPGPSSGPSAGRPDIDPLFAHDMIREEILSAKIREDLLIEIIEEYDKYLFKAKKYADYFRRKGDVLTAQLLDLII